MRNWIQNHQFWVAAGTVLAMNLIILLAYHGLFGRPSGVRIGVVDMAQISSETRTQYIQMLIKQKDMKIDNQEAEKVAAAIIDRTSNAIDKEIREIERECGCLLLMRGVAVGAASMIDYTQRVIKAIGAPT